MKHRNHKYSDLPLTMPSLFTCSVKNGFSWSTGKVHNPNSRERIGRPTCVIILEWTTSLDTSCCLCVDPRHVELRNITSEFYKVTPPWGGVGQFFLGESQSRIYPHMRAKFGRGPTIVSEKKGGGVQTHKI